MARKKATKAIPLSAEQLEERRLHAIDLLKDGLSQADVAREVGVSRQSVHAWSKVFRKHGKKGLRSRAHTGRPPRVDRKVLKKLPGLLLKGAQAHGFEGDVWTLERVAAVIEKELGVTYHPGHVSKLLQKLGLVWKKPRTQAMERDDKAIAKWIREDWPNLKNVPPGSAP